MRRAVAVVESYEAYILEEAAAHAGGSQVVVVHVGKSGQQENLMKC
jgi:electron transfer flavoprotein alpha/beta subunit